MAVSQAAMRRRTRIMRAVNMPMRAALSLPFATPLSGNLMLISHIGRKTGKQYRQPVSYVRDGAVLLTPGGGRWTRNLVSGRPVRIRLRGRAAAARPELVADPVEVERLLGVIAQKNPAGRPVHPDAAAARRAARPRRARRGAAARLPRRPLAPRDGGRTDRVTISWRVCRRARPAARTRRRSR